MTDTGPPPTNRVREALLGVAIFALALLLWYALGSPRAGALPAGAKEPTERIARQFWERLLKGDAEQALLLTRAVEIPAEQRAGWAMYVKDRYEDMGLKRIVSVGPARSDAYIKQAVRVPYSITGKKPLRGEFVLRNDLIRGKHDWLISEGF